MHTIVNSFVIAYTSSDALGKYKNSV